MERLNPRRFDDGMAAASVCVTSGRDSAEALARKPGGGKGACEVQKALLTARIDQRVEHLEEHPKDAVIRANLLKRIAQRRRLPC